MFGVNINAVDLFRTQKHSQLIIIGGEQFASRQVRQIEPRPALKPVAVAISVVI